MLNHSIICLVFLFIQLSNLFSQSDLQPAKASTVLIMPFIQNEKYPYASDEIRFSLITGFLQKGYHVIEDDSTWSKLLKLNYNLANISTEIADTISNYVNSDLIVFGNAENIINLRESSPSNRQLIYKPVLIKVFDTRSKSIIYYERLNLVEYWGLFKNITQLSELGLRIATTLRNRGY
ncbi:hypothetical protein [Rosettibacter firmus]|uniref:hypothetical protein n=1 Tax=Rosettibacter firmus TaxID=3111522 RepID=UPI00336C293A